MDGRTSSLSTYPAYAVRRINGDGARSRGMTKRSQSAPATRAGVAKRGEAVATGPDVTLGARAGIAAAAHLRTGVSRRQGVVPSRQNYCSTGVISSGLLWRVLLTAVLTG